MVDKIKKDWLYTVNFLDFTIKLQRKDVHCFNQHDSHISQCLPQSQIVHIGHNDALC